MAENPYEAPRTSEGLQRKRSVWPRVVGIGGALIAVGILAVVAAWAHSPREYVFLAMALTEKIAMIGIVVAIVGGIGWGVERLRSPQG